MKLQKETLNLFAKRFEQNKNDLIQNSVIHNGIKNTCINHKTLIKHDFVFDIETDLGEITMQSNSGRCWIFASLNMARVAVMKNLNVANFEFSQNYFAFYDKMEKANTFLTKMINNIELPMNDRLIYTFMHGSSASDGGYWEWFASLLNKYGAVPKSIMPETFHSGNTTAMNEQIDLRLKQGVLNLRKAFEAGASLEELNNIKEEVLYEVYDIVSKCLGTPPTEFTFEYRDKDNKYNKIENITPIDFFNKYVGTDFDQKVNLLHDPRPEFKAGTHYVLKHQKSVYDDQDVVMINVPLKEIKEVVINSLKDNVPVWFGCDIDAFRDDKSGILDPELYQYDEVFNKLSLTKSDRINIFNSTLTHAMAFVGVKTENGLPVAWKVENSWGDKYGKKGIFSMSDTWFDEYNFTVIVDKKYVDAKYLDENNNDVVKLELWEPLA
ncbi:C1 family peptidase [Mycoplasma sp. Pen4]|uniref:aminopeptidase C n=1 Tax=Mycoplasma sp. Pen4 TaxID=640330 RepID=UPI00165429C0|nr:C1 family peptidase [Mycoplasma sp. Pen4]QNM93384.1 C1 family peptidase [Mycoplasma sp. Pen4]